MADLTLPLVGLTTLVGYFFSKDKAPHGEQSATTRTKIETFDKPNGATIYSSNVVEEANNELLQRSLKNYKDAQNPAETGMLPPLFNTYGAVGNESMMSPIVSTNFNQHNLQDNAKMYELNRLSDVAKNSSTKLDVDLRPMFRSLGEVVGRQNSTELPTFQSTAKQTEVSLLTGMPIEREHNNMVPFFGSNVKQNVETFSNTPLLDLHTGNTSTFQHKKESQPLFSNKPENIYGNPVFSASVNTERYIPSLYRQNEMPFEKERIAAPKAGTFENPIKPSFKTVNELRPGNRPKDTYKGRTISGKMGDVRGIQADVVKRRPDTFYEKTPGHLFTTVGDFVAPEAPQNFKSNFKPTSREEYNLAFFGHVSQTDIAKTKPRAKSLFDNGNELVDSSVQPPKRENFENDFRRNVSGDKAVHDYGKSTITSFETERATTGVQAHLLNAQKSTNGVRTQLQDDVRTTLKQTTIVTNYKGGIKTAFDQGSVSSFNAGISNVEAKTTHKETLVDNKYLGQAQKPDGMGYVVNKYEARTTNKEVSTVKSNYTGNAGAHVSNTKVYTTYDNPEKVRNAIHPDYTGNAGFATEVTSRVNYNNAEIRDDKEQLISGERPSGPQAFQTSSGMASFGDVKVTPNNLLRERENQRERLNVNRLSQVPSKDSIGLVMRVRHDDNPEDTAFDDRLDPTILKQLKDNPFALKQ
jgi:hypothetical protein